MNYRTLLILEYAYTLNQLLDVVEKYKWLFKCNYTLNEIFGVEYKCLKLKDDEYEI